LDARAVLAAQREYLYFSASALQRCFSKRAARLKIKNRNRPLQKRGAIFYYFVIFSTSMTFDSTVTSVAVSFTFIASKLSGGILGQLFFKFLAQKENICFDFCILGKFFKKNFI
jgi:hypothetical protein